MIAMILDGAIGGSPEVYKKLIPVTGKGAVVIFSGYAGNYSYITRQKPDQKTWKTREVDLLFDNVGHAVIFSKFLEAEAKIIFFGVASD